jgi:ferric-dicitrate binding protein FerR (iron transport regulator)
MASQDPEEDIVLSLLSNKDFKDWILDESGDRDLYWTNWMKSNPDKIQAVNKAREIVQQLRFKEDLLSEQDIELLLGNIISQRVSEEGNKITEFKQQRYTRWLKIAASFLLVLSFVYAYRYWPSEPAPRVAFRTVENFKGQRTRVKLPDSSVVYLNSSSKITYPEVFLDSIRAVALTGEAFFEVTHNPAKPFVVQTNRIRTVVLGTSFNVRAFDTDSAISVSLVSGKVRVVGKQAAGTSRESVLLPGERLVYHETDSSYEKDHFKVLDVTGWKDGVLVFDNTDFNGFVQKMEQWYGIDIIVSGQPSSKWKVNGHFDNESLTEVLVGIQFIYDIHYRIDGNRVILKCK